MVYIDLAAVLLLGFVPGLVHNFLSHFAFLNNVATPTVRVFFSNVFKTIKFLAFVIVVPYRKAAEEHLFGSF